MVVASSSDIVQAKAQVSVHLVRKLVESWIPKETPQAPAAAAAAAVASSSISTPSTTTQNALYTKHMSSNNNNSKRWNQSNSNTSANKLHNSSKLGSKILPRRKLAEMEEEEDKTSISTSTNVNTVNGRGGGNNDNKKLKCSNEDNDHNDDEEGASNRGQTKKKTVLDPMQAYLSRPKKGSNKKKPI